MPHPDDPYDPEDDLDYDDRHVREPRPHNKRKLVTIIVSCAVGLMLLCCGGTVIGGFMYLGASKAEDAAAQEAANEAVTEVVVCKKITLSANNVTYDGLETTAGTLVVAKGKLDKTDDYDGRSRDADQAAKDYNSITPGNKYRVATSSIGAETFGIRNMWVLADLGPTGNCGMLGGG